MTVEKAKSCVIRIGKLFPMQVNQDQGKQLATDLQPFSFEAAEKAIGAHYAAHERLSIPNLLEGCRAAERELQGATETARHEGSVADVYLRQNPEFANASDIEVILRVHWRWWKKCSQSDGYRSKFSSSCHHQLYQILEPNLPREADPTPKFEGKFRATPESVREMEAYISRLVPFIFSDAESMKFCLKDIRGALPV